MYKFARYLWMIFKFWDEWVTLLARLCVEFGDYRSHMLKIYRPFGCIWLSRSMP